MLSSSAGFKLITCLFWTLQWFCNVDLSLSTVAACSSSTQQERRPSHHVSQVTLPLAAVVFCHEGVKSSVSCDLQASTHPGPWLPTGFPLVQCIQSLWLVLLVFFESRHMSMFSFLQECSVSLHTIRICMDNFFTLYRSLLKLRFIRDHSVQKSKPFPFCSFISLDNFFSDI